MPFVPDAAPTKGKFVPDDEEEDYFARLNREGAQLVGNIPGSAAKAVGDMAYAVNPMNWGEIAHNVSEAGVSGIVQGLDDRYGSLEKANQTLINDPVGFGLDASSVLTLGGTGLARAPGIVGRVGRVAAKAGDVIDPIAGAGPRALAKKGGNFVAKAAEHAFGSTTGAGNRAISHAASAGYESVAGDPMKAQKFRANFTGKAEPGEVVHEARGAARSLQNDRSFKYNPGMEAILDDPTPVSFRIVEDAIKEAKARGTVKTKMGSTLTVEHGTATVMKKVNDVLGEWKKKYTGTKDKNGKWVKKPDPTVATMLGFDALKRRIGSLRMTTAPGTAERAAVDRVYHMIRDTLVKQSDARPVTLPDGTKTTYGKVMRQYDMDTEELDELTRVLSLGENATEDTALRKLSSSLRDNFHTNMGARVKLVDKLVENGAPDLVYGLAGQALRPVLKPGLATQFGIPGALVSFFTGHPGFAAMLATFSPRLIGEGAYRAGQISAAVAVPAVKWAKFLEKRGLSNRGIAQTARAVGASAQGLEEQNQKQEQIKNALAEQATKMGYKIHPSLIARLAADLSSDDPELVERGVRTLGSNPRIMKMIEDTAGGQNGVVQPNNG